MSAHASIALERIMPPRLGSVDPSAFPDEEFDLYSIPAFDQGEPEVREGSAIGSAKQIVRPGDVLLSRIVPHIRRAWVVGHARGRRIIASGEWIVFRGEDVDQRYLRHVLIGDPFHAEFMSTVSGVGGSLLRARPAYVAKIKIPLPPLPEQRRIAEILDKADALRAKRRAALAHLDALTQSIFLEMFGDPATNPKGWPWTTLGEVAEFIRGVTFTPDDVVGAEVPATVACMRTKNVQEHLDLSDVWWIGERFVKRKEQYLCGGDILISSANSWNLVGKCCWVPELPMQSTFGGFVSVLRARRDAIDPRVLFTWFGSDRIQATVRSFGQKTTNISNLNVQRVLAMRLPLPSKNAQRAFCVALERQQALRELCLECAAAAGALFAALQDLAFQGEL